MPSRPYEVCPVCGWDPACEYLREERDLDGEARHERVLRHVRSTDDALHNSVEETVELR